MPALVRRALLAHARREKPFECCGFLIGSPEGVAYAVPMENVERSRVRYRIDDRAHIELRRALRLFVPPVSIVGVYHSHPEGPAEPSPTDIAEALYPEWIHVIVGLGAVRPMVRAFQVRGGQVRSVALTGRRDL
jgi:proteasome lid subunit RPN8/RPN11